MSLNVVCLIGRLGREPELSYTASGTARAKFSLAVDRNAKSEGGEQETDWVPCVAWRQSAEFAANYLQKGALVAVEGRLQVHKYQTQDGQNRTVTEVIVNRVQALQSRREREAAASDSTPERHDPE